VRRPKRTPAGRSGKTGFMKNILKRIGISALLVFVTVLPFALLELVNRREFHEAFPFSLFLGMWGLQTAFSFALLSVIR
jgi:hypothetical protein